ncbi:unnamed protein product [Peronospora belbahrii]|uniref:DNA2/NAM7 helicase helicase domain-containing protein n=1 Tax=Peronospora belbahrii TaxID=622444 RepID=A0ABN8CPQ3_9STRA|nr:unnamed protein product [Peronospora belbahrii]
MGDKVCDQPLWPFPGTSVAMNCRDPQCARFATFLCAHKLHAKGYCGKCAGEYQQRLRGPPSSASLRSLDKIDWGEIIFQGKSFDEFKARERGCLTLRLLQYLDEPGNAMLAQNPSVGNAVAIIDCQTFVPDFIPVLKASKNSARCRCHSKKVLSLMCDRVSKVSDDYNSPYEDTGLISSTGVSIKCLIQEVIRSSLLEPIIDIRRDEALRGRLKYSLLQLMDSVTLDPGQLKSFAGALMFPVHCAQGPPGTGKSYLGVVVVRALLVIRELWKLKNSNNGDPPILGAFVQKPRDR